MQKMGKDTSQAPKKGSKTKNSKKASKDTIAKDKNDLLDDIDHRKR